ATAVPSARHRGNVGNPRDGGPGRRALAGAVDAQAARGPTRCDPALLPDDLRVRTGGRIRMAGDRPRAGHVPARRPLAACAVHSDVRDGAAVFGGALGLAGLVGTRLTGSGYISLLAALDSV